MFVDATPAPSGRLRFRCSGLTADGPFTALGAPDGDYSRICWLPVLGPTAWVLWGTIARDLDNNAPAVYDIDELTDAIGLGRSQRLVKTLKRLDRLGLAASPASGLDGCWGLPAMSPPLQLRHLATLSASARRFHHQAIANLDDTDQHALYEIFTSTYIDHFGGHRTARGTP